MKKHTPPTGPERARRALAAPLPLQVDDPAPRRHDAAQGQLRLVVGEGGGGGDPLPRTRPWRLDAGTVARGRQGVTEARAALLAARRHRAA
jgi:hypothetical protein